MTIDSEVENKWNEVFNPYKDTTDDIKKGLSTIKFNPIISSTNNHINNPEHSIIIINNKIKKIMKLLNISENYDISDILLAMATEIAKGTHLKENKFTQEYTKDFVIAKGNTETDRMFLIGIDENGIASWSSELKNTLRFDSHESAHREVMNLIMKGYSIREAFPYCIKGMNDA